jgi:hypothetical protein
MLLLYEDPSGWEALSPEEMQKALEKYIAWTKKSYTVASQRLKDNSGRVLRATGGQPKISDGPYSETKEVLGGYYTIEADSYDQAVERALSHPHLEYGGTIEVREVFSS